MSCDRALPLLYDLIDREIDRAEAIWLAEHLACCPACSARLAQMRSADALFAKQVTVEPPAELSRRVAETVWAHRQAKPGQAREGIVLLTLLSMLVAGASVLTAGGADMLWQRLTTIATAISIDNVLGVLAPIARRASQAWRDFSVSLPAAPRGGWGPLAGGAVALQILGSAWLLTRRRPMHEETR